MHKQDKQLQGSKKFFFDLNNFDDPGPAVPEEDLVPTYSEEELEAAKQAAYAEGKKDGIAEQLASREQKISLLLGQIQQTFQTLVLAEGQREEIYEEESLRLLHAALKSMFPILNSRLGLLEVEAMIKRILDAHQGKTKIIIKIPAEAEADIRSLIDSKITSDDLRDRFKIMTDHAMPIGNCEMAWEDGGAVRDAVKLLEKMIFEVESLLPPQPSHGHTLQKDVIKESDTLKTGQPETPASSGDPHE